jgi:hypothetical protein
MTSHAAHARHGTFRGRLGKGGSEMISILNGVLDHVLVFVHVL